MTTYTRPFGTPTGVRRSSQGKWQAIQPGGSRSLGTFATVEDAARARQAAVGCSHWPSCPMAERRIEGGYAVMRCKLTNKHPEGCVRG